MNIDRYGAHCPLVHPFFSRLNVMTEEIREPLTRAININDKETIDRSINRCLEVFAKGDASFEGIGEKTMMLRVDEIFGSYAEFVDLMHFVQKFFEVKLNLTFELSPKERIEEGVVNIFFEKYGTLITCLTYINHGRPDLDFFCTIVKRCEKLASLTICRSLIEHAHFESLKDRKLLRNIVLKDCNIPAGSLCLPEILSALTIDNCSGLTGMTNIPKELKSIAFYNHDESFRAKFLSKIFNLDKVLAFELFESFEISTYKSFMDFVIGWNMFDLSFYGLFIDKIVLNYSREWFSSYKLKMLKNLYKVYKPEIPENQKLNYSQYLKKIIDVLPISKGGFLKSVFSVVIPPQLKQQAELKEAREFFTRKYQEIIAKIRLYLNLYPFFVQKKMKEKMDDKEYAKFYQNLFYIYLPLLEPVTDERPLKKMKAIGGYAIGRILDKKATALLQMALIDDNMPFEKKTEVEHQHVFYLLQKQNSSEGS